MCMVILEWEMRPNEMRCDGDGDVVNWEDILYLEVMMSRFGRCLDHLGYEVGVILGYM